MVDICQELLEDLNVVHWFFYASLDVELAGVWLLFSLIKEETTGKDRAVYKVVLSTRSGLFDIKPDRVVVDYINKTVSPLW